MWAIIKWVFYILLAGALVYVAIGIGAMLALIGAFLGSLAIGGCVLLFFILMVKDFFESSD